jgi:L-ascorbate metabolism protein UlaG (beta-lactamase superfamily)
MRFPRSRWAQVTLVFVGLMLVILVTLVGSTGGLDVVGGKAEGERLARMQRSPNYRDGEFHNSDTTKYGLEGSPWESMKRWLFGPEVRHPPAPIPTVALTRASFATPPVSGLRATWLGHSTVLVEIDGMRVLFDPVWAKRASPSSLVGPKRFFEVPLPIDQVPELDAVVASHDHYDHLDRGVVKALATGQPRTRFFVPLGVGAHLEKWGVAPERITEMDWWESATLGALTLTATPARHFSGRGLSDKNHTLWASWSVKGPAHRVFHSGDTGPFAGFADIGAQHGPFDLTLLKIGAYGEGWPDIHVTPEQAVDANGKLRGKALLPIHWGTFNLAFHSWDEPADRVVVAALANGTKLFVPKPGESIEPAAAAMTDSWWKRVR